MCILDYIKDRLYIIMVCGCHQAACHINFTAKEMLGWLAQY